MVSKTGLENKHIEGEQKRRGNGTERYRKNEYVREKSGWKLSSEDEEEEEQKRRG